MEQKIALLKKLNAAFIAAKEYDYCPEPVKYKQVAKLLDVGVSPQDLKESLTENQGRRPDEISDEISDIIKEL